MEQVDVAQVIFIALYCQVIEVPRHWYVGSWLLWLFFHILTEHFRLYSKQNIVDAHCSDDVCRASFVDLSGTRLRSFRTVS